MTVGANALESEAATAAAHGLALTGDATMTTLALRRRVRAEHLYCWLIGSTTAGAVRPLHRLTENALVKTI
jgi:hypothetical protein